MTRNPPFIVFEGLDGTGKSTVAEIVADRLGATLIITPQPELRPFRRTLEALFRADSTSQTLFYAACVVEASREVARERAAGTPVVCDRYWASTRAYAAAAGRWVRLGAVADILEVPDLTVLLTADLEIRRSRLAKRGMSLHDAVSLERGCHIADAYEQALRGAAIGRCIRIDTSRLDPSAVAGAVLDRVSP